MTQQQTDIPKAWADLIEAIQLLATHPSNEISPFNCSHDELAVMADSEVFTADEIQRLEELGFSVDGEYGTFYSFRYGSA